MQWERHPGMRQPAYHKGPSSVEMPLTRQLLTAECCIHDGPFPPSHVHCHLISERTTRCGCRRRGVRRLGFLGVMIDYVGAGDVLAVGLHHQDGHRARQLPLLSSPHPSICAQGMAELAGAADFKSVGLERVNPGDGLRVPLSELNHSTEPLTPV